eukprot:14263635-Alexandrium_andersonii.AAC.1
MSTSGGPSWTSSFGFCAARAGGGATDAPLRLAQAGARSRAAVASAPVQELSGPLNPGRVVLP